MQILIKRGSAMGGLLGGPPRPETDKLFIYFASPEDDIAHGFEVNFDRIRNLKPGEEYGSKDGQVTE